MSTCHFLIVQWCRNRGGRGALAPSIFGRAVNLIPTISPTLYHWHLQNVSPSGIPAVGIVPHQKELKILSLYLLDFLPKYLKSIDCRNPSIYNILRCVAWMMGQTNRQPRVWCSKYYFFYTFYRLRALKTLHFIFVKKIRK